MWVISAGWRIVIADRKISIEYRVKKEKKSSIFLIYITTPLKVTVTFVSRIAYRVKRKKRYKRKKEDRKNKSNNYYVPYLTIQLQFTVMCVPWS